jgi:hypothetical protein
MIQDDALLPLLIPTAASNLPSLFNRSFSYFDRPTFILPEPTPWDPPYQTFKPGSVISDRLCFEDGAIAATSFRDLFPIALRDSFLETWSFTFRDSAPSHHQRSSVSGKAWWSFRKAVVACPDAISVHLAYFPESPSRSDLYIEWKSEESSIVFRDLTDYTTALADLTPHLSNSIVFTTGTDYTLPSMGFIGLFAYTRVQSLTFSFSNKISWADKRAFEYYIALFEQVICSDLPDGEGQPLHTGEWPRDRGNWTTKTEEEKVVYQTEYFWELPFKTLDMGENSREFTRKSEVQWVRQFLEGTYSVMGSRAHCVALMVEGLTFREVDLWKLREWEMARK